MIAAAETRLGVRLPDTLRALYRKLNGGYVGWLYVPLVPNPAPAYDDWRGAFSIDYSSLASLDELRTVAEHYSDSPTTRRTCPRMRSASSCCRHDTAT